MGKYKYGDPIPNKYRDRLYDWEGGGYSGCIWECNQGIVTADGHWIPLYSTGRDGIDQHIWYQNKIDALKSELGYDCRNPRIQFNDARERALVQVFGEKWYTREEATATDKRVVKLLVKEQERLDEFLKRKGEYDIEKTHRLDEMFMQVISGETKRDKFEEIGRIDPKHIKATCAKFCKRYETNVGMMTHALDKLCDLGYEVWCTCSDCGEQFQKGNYETFGVSSDSNSYTGDGGIGVIYKRVLCDTCHDEAECPKCYELDRPNEYAKDKGARDWQNYDFLACVIYDWLNVCFGCAGGYEYDYLYRWDDTLKRRVRTTLGAEYANLEDEIKENYELDMNQGHEVYETMKKTRYGRKKINAIRELLYESVKEYFENSIDDSYFDDRLDTEDKNQLKIPGLE